MESRAGEAGFSVIHKVELVIGALSGVQVDALQFALDALKSGTMLSECNFVFHTPMLLLYCRQCENEYIADPEDLICPGCLGNDFEIRQGTELLVKAIHGEKISKAKN